MEHDKVIDKVRKLLALGNHESASPGERDNAIRMAHALLAKHNLDMATVEATGGATQEERVQSTPTFYGRPWARKVAYDIGRLFFCDYVYQSHYRSKDATHIFIGRKSNAVTAAEISKYAVESIRREAHRRPESALGNAWIRSFCLGAAWEINARVKQLIADANKPIADAPKLSNSTALVLANVYQIESAANEAFKKQLFPVLGTARAGKGAAFSGAVAEGRAYGKTVSLQRQVGSTNTPRLK